MQNYLDNSSNGVIYFSFGTAIKWPKHSKTLEKLVLAAFSQLPYNILFKFDSCLQLTVPKNVLCKKWFPQSDILAHKNIKAFVNHGGLHSLEESIANGVPLVGIPFLSDQPENVLKIIKLEIGVGIDPKTLTTTNLKNAILEVAQNSK